MNELPGPEARAGSAVAELPERGERERALIMRAAHRLIGRDGGGSTSVEDILREAGVNRRVFYCHFRSKDTLVLAMQHEAGELVRQGLQAAVDGADDGRTAVVAWIEKFLSIGWEEPRAREGRTFMAPEVGLVAGIAEALEDIYARHRAILVDALARGRADGSLPGAEPERDAFAIHAVTLRCVEMRGRRRLDRPYTAVRDEFVRLFVPLAL
ncbi:TetR/AcrR family transcriptional regulator [Streptomyces sp. NPDC048254]|uniref:TetR/AcrR family transcriptional regulator n=1 Tax=Streptomyces sp. NPDC048254 TaxID=3365525 RepID=UPI003712318D